MSDQRKIQWTHRLEHLLALRERFTAAHQYDRAYETYLTIQHVYDLWADEMFRSRGQLLGGQLLGKTRLFPNLKACARSVHGAVHTEGTVAVTWTGHNEPHRMGHSGSKIEELIDETDFACWSGLP